jgi:hypothetical protein
MLYTPKSQGKIQFYCSRLIANKLPCRSYQTKIDSLLLRCERAGQLADIVERVNYYFPDQEKFTVSNSACNYHAIPKKPSAYYYDMRALGKRFPTQMKYDVNFGDNKDPHSLATIVKSRPIRAPMDRCVLLKLNSVRHFQFVTDTQPHQEKLPQLVWRGKVKPGHHSNRDWVINQFGNHSKCNVAPSNDLSDQVENAVPANYMSREEQLRHRFVLSVEGNDVATNLKWIMASNSLCFMRRPRYETWFMEGRLEAGKHYVELQDDFTDLPEKIEYYLANPGEAEEITHNAQAYVQQFFDDDRELLIQLMVLFKYLYLSGQLTSETESALRPVTQIMPTLAT